MILNQIFQNTINGLNNIIHKDLSVISCDGKIIASTEGELIGSHIDVVRDVISSPADFQCISGCLYFKVFDESVCEYVVKVKGDDEECVTFGKIAAFQIQCLSVPFKDRYDKDNFIKNLLLDNLLRVDIYSRAKKLNIESNVLRIVFLIEIPVDNDLSMLDFVRDNFSLKGSDFVTAVDENNVILVKQLDENYSKNEIDEFAKMISDMLASELYRPVHVSIGTVVNDLKDISRSYKEAKMALEVSLIFSPGKILSNYERLGLGRLIYQLPVELCRMFEREVLHGLSADNFDDETLETVDKFFEYNLNLSETSRQLFIHRNTLVYRLDKIQKMTGLDIRNFDDAIIFKITLMVSKYMEFMKTVMY